MAQQVPPPKKFGLTSRTIVAPLAAFTMACLLYVYSRSAIKAAKRNAQIHREADGGQINWQNENMRRHGMLDGPMPKKGTIMELVDQVRKDAAGEEGTGDAKAKES